MITEVSIDGRRVKALRQERGLTQLELAQVAMVDRGVVVRSETVTGYNTSWTSLWRLADALEVPVEDVLHIKRSAEPMRAAS